MKKRELFCLVYLPPLGLAAGLLNGLLGTGAGILIVYGLQPLLSHFGKDRRIAFVTALACVLPLSLLSAWRYLQAGYFAGESLSFLLLPALFGGGVGAFLQKKIPLRALKRLFSLLVLASGVLMLW